jgi:phosphoribosylformimino-5-aminoimidazole carboxamide ribotide isomerase
MRVVPVLDLLNGKVVRGIAGNRAAYAPIQSRLCADPSPSCVASGFASLGFKECYVADLDAIAGAEPDFDSCRAIIAAGLDRLWIDAGVRDEGDAITLNQWLNRQSTEHRVVIGSETFREPKELQLLVESIGRERLVFSLDLRSGQPLIAANKWLAITPWQVAEQVLDMGVRKILVLDLANVGVNSGVGTEKLCRRIRKMSREVELVAGGGVRSIDDLRRLADWGCDAALVASALHDGEITDDQLRIEFF